MSSSRPLLLVITAPSGAGKSTLCDRLLAEQAQMVYSISCTTRSPRGSEQHERDYYFLTEPEFRARLDNGDFIEHAVVHDHLYGTLRQTVEETLAAGHDVIMDIDVQGAAQIRELADQEGDAGAIGRAFVDIFITPPSLDALRARLTGRGEDAPETIEKRMHNAAGEMARMDEFGHCVVNDDLETAYCELAEIIASEKTA